MLTEKQIAKLEAGKIHYDREGLGLRVTPAGARSWVLDYSSNDGRRRRFTLAKWPDTSLEQARLLAGKWRARIYADENRSDPLDEKKQARETARLEQKRIEADKAIREVAEIWLRTHALAYKRPKSIENDESILKLHIYPKLGDKKINQLNHADVAAMMLAMHEIPFQANRTLGLLNTLLRYAIRQGWRVDRDNPCSDVKRYPESSRVVNLSREKLDKLYKAIMAKGRRSASANAIKLLVWTGARRGEVLGARWSEFDLKHGFWMRPAERLKQKKTSTIPLNDLALELLRGMHASNGKSEWLFPSPRKKVVGPQHTLQTFWRDACKRAGIEKLRLHDLRHVFASVMLEQGEPIAAIAPLLGHSNTVMTKTYAHLSDKALRKATNVAGKALALPAH